MTIFNVNLQESILNDEDLGSLYEPNQQEDCLPILSSIIDRLRKLDPSMDFHIETNMERHCTDCGAVSTPLFS